MKLTILILSTLTIFSSCEKKSKVDNGELSGKNEVAIYLLKTSQQVSGLCKVDPATAVLADTPFTKNEEIRFYSSSIHEFTLTDEASNRIALLPLRANFAVTVNRKVIYYGVYMPVTMSSTCLNSITMHIANQAEGRITLQLGYPGENNNIEDKRNDSKLIAALHSQGKLR